MAAKGKNTPPAKKSGKQEFAPPARGEKSAASSGASVKGLDALPMKDEMGQKKKKVEQLNEVNMVIMKEKQKLKIMEKEVEETQRSV